ncbi:MAG: hypothetical protein WBS24_00670 [Terriglobales bacterium]
MSVLSRRNWEVNGQKKLYGREFVVLRLLFIFFFVLGSNLLIARQPAAGSSQSEGTRPPARTLSGDPAKLAAAIRGSYYHPDEMSGLDCTISIDWPAFFSAFKLNPSAERMKAIQGLKIRSKAARDKDPELTFEWAGGSLDTKKQFESGLNQMLEGFYQMYWAMVASSPISNAAEVSKIEPLPEGGVQVYTSSENNKVVITTDKERTPTRYTLDSPAMKGTISPHYTASPKPVPGDLRRISSLDASLQMGTSILNTKLALDYQTVDGFYIPRHVTFTLVGAYSLVWDFSGCSATKGPITH